MPPSGPQQPPPGRSGTSDGRAVSWSSFAPTAPAWVVWLGWDVRSTSTRGDKLCSMCYMLLSCREKHLVRCDLEWSCCSNAAFEFVARIVNRVLSGGWGGEYFTVPGIQMYYPQQWLLIHAQNAKGVNTGRYPQYILRHHESLMMKCGIGGARLGIVLRQTCNCKWCLITPKHFLCGFSMRKHQCQFERLKFLAWPSLSERLCNLAAWGASLCRPP